MDKAHYKNIGVLLITGLLMVLIVNPIGNFPLSDDWVYARPVLSLTSNGTFMIGGTTAIAIGQILLGALFCLPFGFSFTALRIMVIILGLAGILIFYFLVNRFTNNKKTALLSALLLLVNPIFFSLSNTFMTDVPFLAFTLFALYYFSKAIDSPQLKYLVPALIFSILATLIRQFGLIIPIAYALTRIVKNKPSLASMAKYFLPALGVAVSLLLAIWWLKQKGSGTPVFTKGGSLTSFLSKPDEIGLKIFKRISCMLYYCGISLLPLLCFSGYNSFKSFSARQKTLAGIFIAFCIPFLLAGWGSFPVYGGLGDMVEGVSIGPKTLSDVYVKHIQINNPSNISSAMRNIFSVMGLIGAILLLLTMAGLFMRLLEQKEKGDLKAPYFQLIFLLLFITGYTFLICVQDLFIDRYLLPFLPVILIGVVSSVQKSWQLKPAMLAFSLLFIGITALFSSLGTHDYLQWNRARWEAKDYLTDVLKVQPYQIDGGMEYNGWVFETLFQKKEDPNPWFNDNDWMITYGAVPGFYVIKKIPYTNYIPYEERDIYILEDSSGNGYTPPDTSVQQFDHEIKNLELKVQANPTAEDYYYLGKAYLQSGRYKDCIETTNKVLEINPDYIIAYTTIAMAYGKLYMWNEAVEEERKAIQVDRFNIGAKKYLNYALSMVNSNGSAMSAIDYVRQGVIYYEAGKYEECLAACKKSLELDNTSAAAWNNIGSCYIALKQYDEAEKAINQSLKLKPGDQNALYNLNLINKVKGNNN
jgi:tetratricopeptide (TPR) repeat protein